MELNNKKLIDNETKASSARLSEFFKNPRSPFLALLIFIVFIIPVHAGVSFSYTSANATEISFNNFKSVIVSTQSYTAAQIQNAINLSGEKSPNIIIDSVMKTGANPYYYTITGHLKNYYIRQNKLFNPWWNTSIPYMVNSPSINGSGIGFLNLSNSCGTSNSTWVFGCGNFTYGWNSDTQVNTNLRFTANNNTELPFVFLNITNDNQTALLAVNHTVDGDKQIYYGDTNRVYNNLQGGNDTFPLYYSASGNTIDTNIWTVNSGTVAESNGKLITGTTITIITSKSKYGVNFSVLGILNLSSKGGSDSGYLGFSNGIGRPIADPYQGFTVINHETYGSYTNGYLEVAVDGTNRGEPAIVFPNNRSAYTISELQRYNNKIILSQNDNSFFTYSITSNIPTNTMYIVLGTYGGNYVNYDTVAVFPLPKKSWGTWGKQQNYTPINITSWGNNYTNNQNLNFSVIPNTTINFNASTNIVPTSYTWVINGTDQLQNSNNISYTFKVSGTIPVNLTVYDSISGTYDYMNWSVIVAPDTTPPIAPTLTNGTITTTSIQLWSSSQPNYAMYFWQYTVNGTANWTYSGNTTVNTTTISGLTSGQIYDFRVQVNKTTNGLFSAWSNVITVQTLTTDPSIALLIQKANDLQVQVNALPSKDDVSNAGSIGFVGGVIGACVVIGVLKWKRK